MIKNTKEQVKLLWEMGHTQKEIAHLTQTSQANVSYHLRNASQPSRIHLRGFASMDKEKHLRIASQGGKKAQLLGVAHNFNHEEAVVAGRKGGIAAHKGREV